MNAFKIKAVIIDDEALAISALKAEIEQFIEEVQIIGTAQSVKAGIELINELKPEIVFLDIQLNNESGFEIVNNIKNTPHIIYTTAYSEHAIKAIKHAAFDYLLKPIDYLDIKNAIHRFKEVVYSENQTSMDQNIYENKIAIRDKKEVHLLNVENILYFQSRSNYSLVYLEDGTRIMISKTLKKLEESYDIKTFIRVHQSYLVNSRKIKTFDSANNQVILTDKKEIPVSFRRKKTVFSFINQL